MKRLKELLFKFTATDVTAFIFYLLLIITNLVFCGKVKYWPGLIALELCVIVFLWITNYFLYNGNSRFTNLIHLWYPTVLIFITYKQLYFMIKPIRVFDYDDLLIKIDRFIFQQDPTKALYHIANPLLTEILQLVYFSFYLLPVFLGLFLYLEKKYLETDYVMFSVVYGFFVSYVGYFLLPAIGPRFTLHDFSLMDAELPGIFLTEPLRHFINSGGSVTSMGQSLTDSFQRDVFPSGHTMITLIVMYLAYKLKSSIRSALFIMGTMLIFSTVYLRYHYGIDVIAGSLFAVFSVWSGKILFNKWQKACGRELIKY